MTGSERGKGRLADALTAAAFVAAIALPGAGTLVSHSGEDVLREFRRPAPAPRTPRTAAELVRWPRAAERWFADHFALRTPLIRAWNALLLFGFGTSPSRAVVAGEDGWLFLGSRTYLDYSRAVDPFTPEELAHWRRHLEAKRDRLAESGIEYAFVLAPNKSTVYPERMPRRLRRVGEETRGDQLVRHLAAESDVVVIDLRPPLVAGRASGELLYFPLGSHWNDRGAFLGYEALVRAIARAFPDRRPLAALEPEPREAFVEVESPEELDNWISKLHLDGWLDQEEVLFVPKGRGRKPGGRASEVTGLKTFSAGPRGAPRGFVLRDSFFDALGPFVAPHFSRLVLCTNRVAREVDAARIPRWIEDERPDLVIEELVERALMDELPPLPPWPR